MKKRTEWFEKARFGMFIHWGIYAIPAQGEWYISGAQMNLQEYEHYMQEFNPVDYNPAGWARAAKEAGMQYMVLTAKHHDGFCLFDSKFTDYKATNTPAGRDLVKEYVDAVRAEGLKVGLYFSLLDWHHPNFPKYHDKFHPLRGREELKEEEIDWDNYLQFLHNQVRELCTNYGKLDLLWFDFSYDDMCGEKWRASELLKMVRSLQPDILVDNRLEGGGSSNGTILEAIPSPISGDFASPEQCMPTEGLRNVLGEKVPWELCTTINDSWGYVSSDHNYKPAGFLIRKLVECVSKSGNMILNVGPDAKGRIPQEQLAVLSQIGRWMKENGESIYGCEEASLPRPEWGRYTRNGDCLYAHLLEAPIGPIPITGVNKEEIAWIRRLSDGSVPVDASLSFGGRKDKETQYISLGNQVNATYQLPDKWDTVLKIQLKPRMEGENSTEYESQDKKREFETRHSQ